jgi:hypothetical protein
VGQGSLYADDYWQWAYHIGGMAHLVLLSVGGLDTC